MGLVSLPVLSIEGLRSKVDSVSSIVPVNEPVPIVPTRLPERDRG